MKITRHFFFISTFFLYVSFNDAFGGESLEASCIIESSNFPNFGIESTLSGRATLSGPYDSDEGHKLIASQGDFEFWVLTKTTRLESDTHSILSYYAEIKNVKTGFAVRAASPAKQNSEDLIEAEVSMIVYNRDNRKIGELRMNCGTLN